MNKVILDIVKSNCKDEDKNKKLNLLSTDIEVAKGILAGTYKYCPDCDDYYLTKSYFTEKETKPTRICVYEDPINSGGNEYTDGYEDITYHICPKGHKIEISKVKKFLK